MLERASSNMSRDTTSWESHMGIAHRNPDCGTPVFYEAAEFAVGVVAWEHHANEGRVLKRARRVLVQVNINSLCHPACVSGSCHQLA